MGCNTIARGVLLSLILSCVFLGCFIFMGFILVLFYAGFESAVNRVFVIIALHAIIKIH